MRHAIGIDVGGTTTKGVVITDTGKVVYEATPVRTPTSGAADVAEVAACLARELLTRSGVDAPVGVCVPGIVDEKAGVGVFSANLGWRDAPLRELISARLGQHVTLGHDVRSGALAEATWGLSSPDCLYVAVGTGIATGLILSGRPAPSAPWSGELGQVPVDHPDHPDMRVPLEQVASATGIATRAIECGLLAPGCGAREVQDLAESTDPQDAERAAAAMRILTSSLHLLGTVISVVIHQTGTVSVVLGGGLSKGGQTVLAPLREALAHGCTVVPTPPVCSAQLGSQSQAIGAATSALYETRSAQS